MVEVEELLDSEENTNQGKKLCTTENDFKSKDENINVKNEEVITRQPEKEELMPLQDNNMNKAQSEKVENKTSTKTEENVDCATGFLLCCNFLEQCWLSVCPCVNECCGCGGGECVDATCEGFVACIERCGECCTQCW